MSEPWTQKYAPKTIAEIVEQQAVVKDMLQFVRFYADAKKRAILLHGPPGCGKTSSLYAIAQELGLEIFEVNASDTRNKEHIEQLVGNAITTRSLFGGGKLILIDEVDGIAGNQDRGGVQALIALLEKSCYPIIMTCNDPYEQKFNSLRSKCKIITLAPLSLSAVTAVLTRIAQAEHIEYEEAALKQIARMCQGDLRGAINDLQATSSQKRKLTLDDVNVVGDREKNISMQEALSAIFKDNDFERVGSILDSTGEDLDEAVLWLEENIPREYQRPGERYRAFHALAMADVHRGRIRRRQEWRFLVYVNTFLSCGISAAKVKKTEEEVTYSPTSRILKIWQAKMSNAKRDAISEKLSSFTHTSKKRAMKDILPFFKIYAKANQRKAEPLFEKIGLNEEEREWLLSK